MPSDPGSFRAFAGRAFDPAAIPGKPEALAGVRVLEVATRIFGPATADYLGLFGAEVIKVEMPPRGDLMRYVAPEGFFWKEVSPAFLSLNRNKLHVGLDLHPPEGKELFLRLAERSDVVVENLRAGTMDAWGVGYLQLRERNPRIVYAANSGFGQWGPYSAGRASYDATAQAVSGFSAITGFPDQPPMKAGFWVGDYTAALMSANAILAALAARRKTGEGQMIDLSQAEAMIRTLDWTWPYAGLTGKDRARNGNVDPSYPPSGIYRCRDGFVAVSARDEDELIPLAHAVGPPIRRRYGSPPRNAWGRFAPPGGSTRSCAWPRTPASPRRRCAEGRSITTTRTCGPAERSVRWTIPSTAAWTSTDRRRSSRRAREGSSGARNPWGGTTSGSSGICWG